jgi:hypothetical protein
MWDSFTALGDTWSLRKSLLDCLWVCVTKLDSSTSRECNPPWPCDVPCWGFNFKAMLEQWGVPMRSSYDMSCVNTLAGIKHTGQGLAPCKLSPPTSAAGGLGSSLGSFFKPQEAEDECRFSVIRSPWKQSKTKLNKRNNVQNNLASISHDYLRLPNFNKKNYGNKKKLSQYSIYS